ncbi:hypothetical protein I3760_03G192500 [Carya illinoinensis]|nr:hypothetical protein I3760_03G192500 [Carya illinoinensis]
MAKNLESLFPRFWWELEDNQNKKFTPMSSKSIYLSKFMGGLGLKQMSTFNSTLVTKYARFPLNGSTSLWKEVISKIYLGTKTFLEVQPKISDSCFWKSLLKQKDFLRSSVCYQINNGASTKVWSNPWIPTIPNSIPHPNPINHVLDQNMTVSELTLEEPRCWNILLLNTLFFENSSGQSQLLFCSR